MARYEGPIVVGMEMEHRASGIRETITEIRDGVVFGNRRGGSWLHAYGLENLREHGWPVRPADGDREAWARFLPTAPLNVADCEKPYEAIGAVVLLDPGSWRVVVLVTDADGAGVVLAGKAFDTIGPGGRVAWIRSTKRVLLFDAPAPKSEPAPTMKRYLCEADRGDGYPCGADCDVGGLCDDHRPPDDAPTPTACPGWCGSLLAAIDADGSAPPLSDVFADARDGRGYCGRKCHAEALEWPPRIEHAALVVVRDLRGVPGDNLTVCSACGREPEPSTSSRPWWCTPDPQWRAKHEALIAASVAARDLGMKLAG